MAATTSFHNSGLSVVLLPAIQSVTGLEFQFIAVGTGQALRFGRAGDVDAILVLSRPVEDAFSNSGFGTYRREIMYNDFVIVGPKPDPAGVGNSKTVLKAIDKIATRKSTFVSRGDDSGTHKKTLSLA